MKKLVLGLLSYVFLCVPSILGDQTGKASFTFKNETGEDLTMQLLPEQGKLYLNDKLVSGYIPQISLSKDQEKSIDVGSDLMGEFAVPTLRIQSIEQGGKNLWDVW